MGTIWAVISLLAVWLIYGLFAALFVKGIGSRDAIPLLLSGMIGGATGGQLSQLMEIPTYLWWMSELMKFLLTILSLYIISICLLYTSPSPRDRQKSRMPSSA